MASSELPENLDEILEANAKEVTAEINSGKDTLITREFFNYHSGSSSSEENENISDREDEKEKVDANFGNQGHALPPPNATINVEDDDDWFDEEKIVSQAQRQEEKTNRQTALHVNVEVESSPKTFESINQEYKQVLKSIEHILETFSDFCGRNAVADAAAVDEKNGGGGGCCSDSNSTTSLMTSSPPSLLQNLNVSCSCWLSLAKPNAQHLNITNKMKQCSFFRPQHLQLIQNCRVRGASRYYEKILQEAEFLEAKKNGICALWEKEEADVSSSALQIALEGFAHCLRCCNVSHFSAILRTLELEENSGVVAIEHKITAAVRSSNNSMNSNDNPECQTNNKKTSVEQCASGGQSPSYITTSTRRKETRVKNRRLAMAKHLVTVIDVISCYGLRWIKVRAGRWENLQAELMQRGAHDPSKVVVGDADDFSSEMEESSSEEDLLTEEKGMGSKARSTNSQSASQRSWIHTIRRVQQAALESSMNMLPCGLAPQVVIASCEWPNDPCKMNALLQRLSYVTRGRINFVDLITATILRGHDDDNAPNDPTKASGLEDAPTQKTEQQKPSIDKNSAEEEKKLISKRTISSTWRYFQPLFIAMDVTALISICCEVCNGGAGMRFLPMEVLDRQSLEEANGDRAVEGYIIPTLQNFSLSSCLLLENNKKKEEDDWKKEEKGSSLFSSSFWMQLPTCAESFPKDIHFSELTPISVEYKNQMALLDQLEKGQSKADSPLFNKEEFRKLVIDGSQEPFRSVVHIAMQHHGAPNWIVEKGAWKKFCDIISSPVAGPGEVLRARKLSYFLRVVSQDDLPRFDQWVSLSSHALAHSTAVATSFPSTEANYLAIEKVSKAVNIQALKDSAAIQNRHRQSFSVADKLCAISLTANKQFVLAAVEQCVALAIIFHPPRAFTETKRKEIENNCLDSFAPKRK